MGTILINAHLSSVSSSPESRRLWVRSLAVLYQIVKKLSIPSMFGTQYSRTLDHKIVLGCITTLTHCSLSGNDKPNVESHSEWDFNL